MSSAASRSWRRVRTRGSASNNGTHPPDPPSAIRHREGHGELRGWKRLVSLLKQTRKECILDAAARVTSKGQVTVPKVVREALGIVEGDEIVFRVDGNRAVLARTPDFLELAGSIQVPAAKRNVAWDDVIRRTRAERAPLRR